MSSQSKIIQLTVRLENSLYQQFHKVVSENGHTHVAVLRLLIKKWLADKTNGSKP